MLHTGEMKPERVLALVVAVIVLVAIAAAVVVALRPEPDYEPSTPEGAVQRFLEAVLDDDFASAATYLDPAGACDEQDLIRAGRFDVARVVLEDVREREDTAQLDVTIVRGGGGGPFDAYEYEEHHTYQLVRSDGGWLLTGEPWPLYFCSEGRG
jgi:hypothetical protein